MKIAKFTKGLFLEWTILEQSLQSHGVDYTLQKQIECETDKRKTIVRRFLDVTLFLGSRDLSFQGDNSTIGVVHVHNCNFLGILELPGETSINKR